VALNDFNTNNVIVYKHRSIYNLHFLSYTRKIFNLKCDWENHIFTGAMYNSLEMLYKLMFELQDLKPKNQYIPRLRIV